MPNQYANRDNVRSLRETTGPQIFAQTAGQVDCFVDGMGTGWTLMWVAGYIGEQKLSVWVVGVKGKEAWRRPERRKKDGRGSWGSHGPRRT